MRPACRPGKSCFTCEFEDCIGASRNAPVSKEETEMRRAGDYTPITTSQTETDFRHYKLAMEMSIQKWKNS